ncbi:MAG: DNA-deoxyinosine glycosylase [Nautiliaceae bacterium]
MEKSIFNHPFEPIVFKESEILILGTFPSIKSFENNFYYSHPKNQFWEILAEIFQNKKPASIKEKIEFLKKHKIALWDTICKAKRKENNSRDDNLEIIEPCDIKKLLKKYPNIKKIAVTSRLAQKVMKKYFPDLKIIYLTSPSPLNARINLNQKVLKWKELLELT